jgi:mono/diheme cytochrome c family protein
MLSRKGSLVALAAACLAGLAAMSGAETHKRTLPRASLPQKPIVTPVEGPSRLHHLGINFQASGMGRTGVWGPTPESYEPPPADFTPPETNTRPVVLSGADVYRLSCRSCHQADGSGSPPEIPAITGPLQATSATLMERRMLERGHPITPAFARELAAGSKKDLLDRLKNGGLKMPAFGYLTANEVHAVIGYLDVLAAVPDKEKPATVTEPQARVGELLVKGTCHICHDAEGTWPRPDELLGGSIPPIAGFTTRKTLVEFIWKVRHGAPVVMGSPPLPFRGRMPVFDYLSDDDVVSAHLYLMKYPPRNARGLEEPRG